MKKIISLVVLIFILLICFSINSQAVVNPTSNFYVNDYANILSKETEDFIMNNSVSLANKTSAQIVVVTVPNLEGRTIEDYANDLFNKFGIGDKDKNNGLLILVALEERDCRIEVGYGLEGILPDGKCGRYQDEYMIPYYKNNNFDEGTVNCYKAFFAEIAKEYNYETDIIPVGTSLEELNRQIERENNFSKQEDVAASLLLGKIFAFFLFLRVQFSTKKSKIIAFSILETITLLITYLSYKSGAGNGALLFIPIGTIINIIAVNLYLPSSGHGGYGGSYSSHSSHSSGGGFHGGGGHSGGGGSSRHF